MLNSRPNNKKYNQGNFIPTNKDKVHKLNNEGGLYFRSSLEKKFMYWLDNHNDIVIWGCENLEIPYQLTHFENGDVKIKNHRYYPDFYYKIKRPDGSIKDVVVEVKPMKEYKMVLDLNEGKLTVPDKGLKKLKNFEYDLKTAQKNKSKWETMIKWCDKKGYDFIIITEEHLKKFNV
jgi:hypothetical protein